MTWFLSFPPCPACGCDVPRWAGCGFSSITGGWNAWTCPACGHRWRAHVASPTTNPAPEGANQAGAGSPYHLLSQHRSSEEVSSMTPADAYDQTRGPVLPCPLANACEVCSQPSPELTAVEADSPVGVFCLTLCPACVDAGRLPWFSALGAARRVLAHCGHPGRDLDTTAHPDSSWGPCLRCGRWFSEREDRPYCPACEDGPHDTTEGVGW